MSRFIAACGKAGERLMFFLDGHPRLRLVVKGGYLCVVSPRGAWAKIRERIRNKVIVFLEPYRRLWTCTYARAPFEGNAISLFSVPSEVLQSETAVIRSLAAMVMDHRFDLLGSGWVRVDRNRKRNGVHGHMYQPSGLDDSRPFGEWLAEHVTPGNLKVAARIGAMVSSSYTPISWEEDFKSGFHWPVDAVSAQLTFGDKPGADIKVPWELSRMQHLPWLAFAAILSREGEGCFEAPERYVREFMDQSVDFFAANPPQYGPNWMCTMDVAFRAVSLIAAHDFFVTAGFEFPEGFEREFGRAIRDHAEHIVSHLEYHPTIRANHYYSDIVGLLFVAAWLPSNAQTDCWLAFAIQEYLQESRLQFHEEGSGFEASTSYHRMCSEMLVYGAALIEGLPERRVAGLREYDHSLWKHTPPLAPALELDMAGPGIVLPEWLRERMEGARRFALEIASPEGDAIQIGDNDSGRFLKLFPSIQLRPGKAVADGFDNVASSDDVEYPFELMGDFSHIQAAFDGFFFGCETAPEQTVVARLAGHNGQQPGSTAVVEARDFAPYPQFGLWMWRRDGLSLTVRCGHNGQYDNGGHAHNDQLSLTLACGGLDFLVDPGTYLYTSLPEWRNRFRSTRVHNTVAADAEQNEFMKLTLFALHNQAHPEVLRVDEDGFEGRHVGLGETHFRSVLWEHGGLRVEDRCAAPEATVCLTLHPGVQVSAVEADAVELVRGDAGLLLSGLDWVIESGHFSPAYGWVTSTKRLTARLPQDGGTWTVRPVDILRKMQ